MSAGRSDREWVEFCRNGHPEAYRALVSRYQAVVLAHLAGRTGDREQAAELAQETFVRGYFALDKLKKPASFLAWLLGIADRVLREHHRQLAREREARQGWAHLKDQRRRQESIGLEAAIAELPELYRQVILLRYYGGQSCAQIADDLGVPLGTVTNRLSRSYRMLRESLGQLESTESHNEVPT